MFTGNLEIDLKQPHIYLAYYIEKENLYVKLKGYSGTIYHFKNGKYHHDDDDCPSVEYKNGDRVYYKNGLKHRNDDKPAVEYANGEVEYFKDGIKYEPITDSQKLNTIKEILSAYSN